MGVGEADEVGGVVPAQAVVPARLPTRATVQLPQHHKGKEDKHEDDDGDGDADQDCRVVRVGADPLAPSCLGEFVPGCVRSHLATEKSHFMIFLVVRFFMG